MIISYFKIDFGKLKSYINKKSIFMLLVFLKLIEIRRWELGTKEMLAMVYISSLFYYLRFHLHQDYFQKQKETIVHNKMAKHKSFLL